MADLSLITSNWKSILSATHTWRVAEKAHEGNQKEREQKSQKVKNKFCFSTHSEKSDDKLAMTEVEAEENPL